MLRELGEGDEENVEVDMKQLLQALLYHEKLPGIFFSRVFSRD
jgi:hypothetical protein